MNTDGSIVQCIAFYSIAHHAGFGDTGHNELYGISDDGHAGARDTRQGRAPTRSPRRLARKDAMRPVRDVLGEGSHDGGADDEECEPCA